MIALFFDDRERLEVESARKYDIVELDDGEYIIAQIVHQKQRGGKSRTIGRLAKHEAMLQEGRDKIRNENESGVLAKRTLDRLREELGLWGSSDIVEEIRRLKSLDTTKREH